MLMLPNMPPLPTAGLKSESMLPSSLVCSRAALFSNQLDNFNDSIRYVLNLEEYLQEIFKYLYRNQVENSSGIPKASTDVSGRVLSGEPENEVSIDELIKFAATLTTASTIPWNGIVNQNSKFSISTTQIQWNLIDEIVAILVSISFIYCKIAGELANELIDEDLNPEATNNWKKVVGFYKTATSYSLFGSKIITQSQIDPNTFSIIIKIIEISMQMSIIAKSSWLNRNTYNQNETFNSNNNGTLARVAIYIVNDLKNLKSLTEVSSNSLSLNLSNWSQYLSIIEKYTLAYAGEFLSIEYYQQRKLGQAIGLVNFSLLTLQSKKMDDKPSRFNKLKSKFNNKKNEILLNNLNSVSTLNIDKSIFNEKSGILLNDLSYLFDQLIKLHLKFSKENDTLVFDNISDWKDINKDSKWPSGCQIPVTAVEPYDPLNNYTKPENVYSGKGAYY